MARGFSFELTGIRNLQAALERASQSVRAKVAAINEETARAIQARARANAPRDRGDLVRSIEVRGAGLNWRVGVVDARIPSRGGTNSAHLNPAVYGVWYEFGFVTRKIAAHPFMRPAVDAERQRYENRLREATRNIESAMRRAA